MGARTARSADRSECNEQAYGAKNADRSSATSKHTALKAQIVRAQRDKNLA